jgi:hypothetical protein
MKNIISCIVLLFVCLQAVPQEVQNPEQRQIRFLENRMNQLSFSAPLSSQKKERIQNSFLALSKAFPDEGNRVLFRKAVLQNVTDSVTVYTIFQNEIDTDAKRRATADLARERRRYNLSEEQSRLISRTVLDRARRLTLYSYLYGDSEVELDKKTNLANNDFEKSVQIILTKRGIRTNLSKYCMALDWRRQLSLTEQQADAILLAGWDIFQRNRTEKIVSIRDEQHKVAKEILSEEQYDRFLTQMARNKAIEDTRMAWNEAIRLGLDAQLDSARVYPQILAYSLERAKIRERFRIIPDGQQERDRLLSNLSVNNKPDALKHIHAVRNREAARQNQDRNTVVW